MTSRHVTQFRWQVPRRHGEILLVPTFAECCRQAVGTSQVRKSWGVSIGEKSLAQLAEEARQQVWEVARKWMNSFAPGFAMGEQASGPWVLTGHQPELFHPGVWLKNFVAGALAQAVGGVALNVLIDNDRAKNLSVWVLTGGPDRPSLQLLPIDQGDTDVAYEMQRVRDWDLVESFAQRAQVCLRPWEDRPLVETFWPAVLGRLRTEQRLFHAVAQARNQLEAAWGLKLVDVPLSWIADLPAHQYFLAFLLNEFPRLVEAYNQALDRYRAENRIRNRAQPLPNLEKRGAWQEIPFWVWTKDAPARRRLFVSRDSGVLALGDGEGWQASIPAADGDSLSATVEGLITLRQQGVFIRPRALMTTLFLRVVVGDYFIHGLGGARYDQVTDDLIVQLFGMEPPPFAVVSGTLYLVATDGVDFQKEIGQLSQMLRELAYHPERFFCNSLPNKLASVAGCQLNPEVERLISIKRLWINTPKTPQNARQRHLAISEANNRLRDFLRGLECELKERLELLQKRQRDLSILRFREIPFCFFREEVLRQFFAQVACQPSRFPV